MRVESPRQSNAGMERLSTISREPFSTKLETGLYELYVWTLLERIVNNSFVLVDGDGTS